MTMIRRSTATGFWVGTAVVIILCAVWVEEVEGWTDLGPCGRSTRGGMNDPTCFWGKAGKGSRKIVKKLAVFGRTEVSVDPEVDEKPDGPADELDDENINNNVVIVGH